MKIYLKGHIFNPCGIATANREIVKELEKLSIPVQVSDPWRDGFSNAGLSHLNNSINVKGAHTIYADYPQFWNYGFGRLYGFFLHEGTKLFPGWAEAMNKADRIFVPSKATKNLFMWNDIIVPVEIIPYGTNPEIYEPAEKEKTDEFVFLSVNSWTGDLGDRKGTDLLIKAFDEEFKDEKVKLVLKIGTFWGKNPDYMWCINQILGHPNPNILFNNDWIPEKELAESYQKSDCFVSPTMGEAFGLTIINAMASGLPVIVTKDVNSGHMDFCKGKDSVLFIDAPTVKQGDERFYAKGNMLAQPDLESLKKQMRFAYENKDDLRKKAVANSDEIRTKWTWKETARKLTESIGLDDSLIEKAKKQTEANK